MDLTSQMPIATKSSKFDISKESLTASLAKKFSKIFKKGDVIFLYGEIGVGKTTFVKYLINSFQKQKKIPLTEVTSPTFSLLNEYKIKNLTIHHFDLFRIKDANETENIGLFENYKDILTLIEWPEKIINKPKKIYELYFNYNHRSEKRFISIYKNSLKFNEV